MKFCPFKIRRGSLPFRAWVMALVTTLFLSIFSGCANTQSDHGTIATTQNATTVPENLTEIPMTDMVETFDYGKQGWSGNGSNAHGGLPILIKTPDPENITLEFRTEHGSFFHSGNFDEVTMIQSGIDLGNQGTAPSDHAVYWKNYHFLKDGTYTTMGENPTNYIRVLLRAEDHIVGYVALSTRWLFYKDNCFELATLQYLYYPKVDGQYQDIPESYVNAEMDRIIAEAEEAYLAKRATKPLEENLSVSLVHQLQHFDLSKEGALGVPIQLVLPDYKDLSLEYIATQGSFFYDPNQPDPSDGSQLQYQGQRFSAPQDHVIYWRPYRLAPSGDILPEDSQNSYDCFAILREGENIVGCINFSIGYYASEYTPQHLFWTIAFPKVEGKYQNVSEEYVLGWIDAHT